MFLMDKTNKNLLPLPNSNFILGNLVEAIS